MVNSGPNIAAQWAQRGQASQSQAPTTTSPATPQSMEKSLADAEAAILGVASPAKLPRSSEGRNGHGEATAGTIHKTPQDPIREIEKKKQDEYERQLTKKPELAERIQRELPRKANGGASENDEVVFLALAKLSPVEYDRCRKKEAKTLGIGVTTLDDEVKSRRPPKPSTTTDDHGQAPLLADPEPWKYPVTGPEVLEGLSKVFEDHLTLPEGASIVLALWTVFSHAHDAFTVSPILAITSPEKGCGKTTLEMLLGAVTRRPLPTANITASSLFRAVEQFHPCLLIDEADTFIFDNDELRGIVNSGWLRSQACVVRSVPVGDDFEARIFSTWSPKVIAQIGNSPDTIRDRSIEIRMHRQLPAEEKRLRRLRADRLAEFEPFRRKAFRLANDWAAALKVADPQMPEGFTNRLADNWRPLFAISDLAGEGWGAKAREAAQGLTEKLSDESIGAMLLTDLKGIFDANEGIVPTSEIIEKLVAMDERPWPEFSRGKPITGRGLAKVLGRFGIKPERTNSVRGYNPADFEDSFSRYLPVGGS